LRLRRPNFLNLATPNRQRIIDEAKRHVETEELIAADGPVVARLKKTIQ
jgi:hypothetical protein